LAKLEKERERTEERRNDVVLGLVLRWDDARKEAGEIMIAGPDQFGGLVGSLARMDVR
jgi:hypothetical protein